MFAGLSGGSEFWKGENAAERISKLDEGIASATGLKSTTDILTYKAFRDAGIAIGEGDKAYIQGGSFEAGVLNTFAAMEGGLNSKNFEAISKTFANAYDGDIMSNVAAWKELSGLNWRGAMELYNMQQELLGSNGEYDSTELEKRIKKLSESPESSDNARDMQNWQNVLSQLAAEFGQHYYSEELEKIAANTEELKGILNENAEKWAMKDVKIELTPSWWEDTSKNWWEDVGEKDRENGNYSTAATIQGSIARDNENYTYEDYVKTVGNWTFEPGDIGNAIGGDVENKRRAYEAFKNAVQSDRGRGLAGTDFLTAFGDTSSEVYKAADEWARTASDATGQEYAYIMGGLFDYVKRISDSDPTNDNKKDAKAFDQIVRELQKIFTGKEPVSFFGNVENLLSNINKQMQEGMVVRYE